ncbi:MAG: ribonuclease R [Bacillota bacterium]
MRTKIQDILAEHSQCSLTVKQMLSLLELQEGDKEFLTRELGQMTADGLIIKTARGNYGLPERLDCHTGVLQGNRRGFAFLRPDSRAEDIFISAANLKDAVHGDRVVVRMTGGRGRRRREGEVIGILKRGSTRMVGTLEQHGKRFFVVPDDSRLSFSIQVPREGQQFRRGDKVVVEVRNWSRGNQPIRGRLVERLGEAGSQQAERLTLHRKFDLPGEFPSPVLSELSEMPREEAIARISQEESRLDLSDLTIVTIDDETARDFDDAVSLENAENGGFRLGVHIADVSQYVREGKPLDREALKRSTSTYLVDRVIHMLPPLLSEELCSLQASRDRLAVTVFINLAADGEIVAYSFHPSLIRVTERLTYRQVEAFLDGNASGRPFIHPAVEDMVSEMGRLASILRQRRLQRGSLDLDLPEAQIILDENGVPTAIERRQMGRSESLIEEFMILCNEIVAGHFYKEELPFIYRVHTLPTAEKLAALRETLAMIGNDLVVGLKELKPKHLNLLLERSRSGRTEKLVRYLMLRSLPQARYSASNEGHFGLASRCYCHFTSPIRRYPDLVIHRILKEYLIRGGLSEKRVARLQSRLPAIAQHSSERERAAMEAERASTDQKKAQFMEDKLGEVYSGIISGVANFGVFVELSNTVEGMIPIADLDDDYYTYQEKQVALVGERKRKIYRLGDPLQVQVVRTNRAEGKVTFALAEKSG